MITTTPVTAYGFANFNDALFQLIKRFENDIPFVYADGKGIPTLGVGYALIIETNNAPPNKYVISNTYLNDLSSANISQVGWAPRAHAEQMRNERHGGA